MRSNQQERIEMNDLNFKRYIIVIIIMLKKNLVCKVDYYLISRRIGVRFGEIEGDRIDIRPEIQGDRTVQDSKITSTNKSESLLLQYYSL